MCKDMQKITRQLINIFLSIFIISIHIAFAEEKNLSMSKIAGIEDFSISLQWDDNFFNVPAYSYNHNLARASCVLALAAYTNIYSDETNALKIFYDDFGFDSDKTEYFYDIDYDDTEKHNNQCAFSLASKKIKNGKTLIVISIRGTPASKEEWLSNTNIADSVFDSTSSEDEKNIESIKLPNEHEGFSIATNQVLENLTTYIIKHKIDISKTIFWITGHSRGAAVTNLLAYKLNQRNIPAEHIYAYTFASPNVTRAKDYNDEKYDYIFNIVNQEDLVPTVPFEYDEWNYHKYGVILALPNEQTTKSQEEYDNKYYPAMNEYFKTFFGRDYCPFRSGIFIPYLFSVMTQYINKNPEEFYTSKKALHNKITKALTSVFSNKNSNTDSNKSKINIFTSFVEKQYPGMIEYIAKAFNDMHNCASYLAWMLAFDEDDLFVSGKSYIFHYSGNADFTITDDKGKILAKTINGVPESVFKNKGLPIIQFPTGTIYLNVPGNKNIHVELSKNSILNTVSKISVDTFAANGKLISQQDLNTFSVNNNVSYSLELKASKDLSESSVTVLKGRKAYELAKKNAQHDFNIKAIIGIDTDSRTSLGLQLGFPQIYAITEFMGNTKDKYMSNVIATGLGLQTPLKDSFYIGIESMWKFFIDFNSSDSESIAQMPYSAITITYQPRWKFQIFTEIGLDYKIKGWNDIAFTNDTRLSSSYMKLNISDNLTAYPSLKFGIKL